MRTGIEIIYDSKGSSERLYHKSTTRPSSEGAEHGDEQLCSCSPGDVLSELKLAVQGATLHFSKGQDGLLHGSMAISPRIHAFPGPSLYLYCAWNPCPLGSILSLALQIPVHPVRLNSMLHFQKVSPYLHLSIFCMLLLALNIFCKHLFLPVSIHPSGKSLCWVLRILK